jgi:phosphonate transport system substrate-binding protein
VHDDAETEDRLIEIVVALGSLANLPCRTRPVASPAALVQAYAAGEVNLLWSSPSLALVAPELRGAVPIVSSVRQGRAHYHGVLFVRADSPIKSPLQLRGARAAWVASTSAGGYIFPRVALAGHGIDPAGLYASERFLGTHGAVAAAVADGEADVGATFAVFEGGDASRSMLRSGYLEAGHAAMRVILATPPIPADLFLASPSLHLAFEGGLPDIMRALARDAPVAVNQVFGADDFADCDERQLEALRRQLEDAHALGVFG